MLRREVGARRSERTLTPLELPRPAEAARATGKQSQAPGGNYENQFQAILKSYGIDMLTAIFWDRRCFSASVCISVSSEGSGAACVCLLRSALSLTGDSQWNLDL